MLWGWTLKSLLQSVSDSEHLDLDLNMEVDLDLDMYLDTDLDIYLETE